MKDSKFTVTIVNDKTNAIITTTIKAKSIVEARELANSQYKNKHRGSNILKEKVMKKNMEWII